MIAAIKAQKRGLLNPQVVAAKENRIIIYQRQVDEDIRSKNSIEFVVEDDLLYRVQQNFVELYCQFADTEI